MNASFEWGIALQLAGLLPCLFVIALLAFMARDARWMAVPILYFCSLAASFLLPLQPYLLADSTILHWTLTLMQAMQPALCFLLIVQFLSSAPPRLYVWCITAIPLVWLVVALQPLHIQWLCSACESSTEWQTLAAVFSSSSIFLLLVMYLSQVRIRETQHGLRRHIYWLVVALIGLYLVLLALDLAWLSGKVTHAEHLITGAVVRISFLYLVLTSLFRVFDKGAGSKPDDVLPKPIDPTLISRIEQVMQEESLYREMGFSRESFARHVGMTEHALSRAINQHYGKNFNEFVNGYRVEEAKQRLAGETTPVTAIAFEVGFSSIASFNRVFKLLAGVSPSEYRQQASGTMRHASG